MIDVTHKNTTLRTATAQAILSLSLPETMDALKNGKVPKGDVFAMAKAAGLLGVKQTAMLIPDCHPMPVEYTDIRYRTEGLDLMIEVCVKTIYRTGVEVEAMHGASVVALTAYDMLKPIDKNLEIKSIKLLNKKGGKSDFKKDMEQDISAAVVVISDSVSAGKKDDKSGKTIVQKLNDLGVTEPEYHIIPDEPEEIKALVLGLCEKNIDLILTTGGTGLSPRDKTPEALASVIEQEIPGIMEAARNYGQGRTPYAMLSRGTAGLCKRSLVIALPGSSRGAAESMDALFPGVLHIFKVLEKAYRHQDMKG